MPQFQKILLILAANKHENKREELVVQLCKEFGEKCQSMGIDVDWIDLYEDAQKEEFDPIGQLHQKDAKIVEYQFRIKRADCIVFFHPVRYNSVPAILKGFIDLVFTKGFAFSAGKTDFEPLLKNKKAIVFAFSENFGWQNKLFYNNTLKIFWKRGVFELCGIKNEYILLSGLQNFNEKTIQSVTEKVLKTASKLDSSESWLDLL